MLKNFLKFSFGSWVSAAISFFTVPIITLLISPEQFGKASMFTLSFAILSQIVLFGSDQSFVRFFYEYDEDKRPVLLWNAILPSVVVWCCVCAVIVLCWRWFSNWLIEDYEFLIVGLLCVNLLITIFGRYANLVIRMQKKGVLFSVLQIAISVINAIVIIVYSKLVDNTFYAVIFGMLCSSFLIAIVSIVIEHKFWFSRLSVCRTQLSAILRYGLPFLPTCLMAMLFEVMDKIFIREFVGFEGLGLYSVAFKVVAVLSIIQAGFSMFWAPTSYENYEKNPNDKTLYENVFKYVSFILVLCGLSVIAAKDIIVLLFSSSYREAASIMPFLIFIPTMYILTEITTVGINFVKKTYWYIVIFLILLLLCPLFNYLFIRLFDVKGAAMAVALSYICYFTFRTLVSIQLYPMNFNLLKTFSIFLLLFVVACVNTFVDNKVIGIGFACSAILIYLSFNIFVIKDMITYFVQIANNMIINANKQ
jgi:O-antigen/teichoic acid export membrane protein